MPSDTPSRQGTTASSGTSFYVPPPPDRPYSPEDRHFTDSDLQPGRSFASLGQRDTSTQATDPGSSTSVRATTGPLRPCEGEDVDLTEASPGIMTGYWLSKQDTRIQYQKGRSSCAASSSRCARPASTASPRGYDYDWEDPESDLGLAKRNTECSESPADSKATQQVAQGTQSPSSAGSVASDDGDLPKPVRQKAAFTDFSQCCTQTGRHFAAVLAEQATRQDERSSRARGWWARVNLSEGLAKVPPF